MTPTDPLYKNQFQFKSTGDFETIWKEFTGKGVTVGVYDDGVQYSHPDLDGNIDASQEFTYFGTTYDGRAETDEDIHGTGVAGIIAAEEGNNIGGVGVAWDSKIASVPVLAENGLGNTGFFIELGAYNYAQNYDIMSNSWGYDGFFDPDFSALGNNWMGDVIRAFETVARDGRDGLGTFISKAAGNDFFNANGSGLESIRQTASISLTDENGAKVDYSNHGTNILVAGPWANVTTDVTGSGGYTNNDYTDFGGTSASAPFVSGVVALMLDANDALGWRDIQNILAITAQDTGSGYGNSRSGDEVFGWQSNGATKWNGGAMTFSQDYGYGLVDGYAATRMAEVWLLMHDNAQTSANEQSHMETMRESPSEIRSNRVEDFQFTVAAEDNLQIEHVTVDIYYRTDDLSDVLLELVSPDGEVFRLYDADVEDGLPSRQNASWSFGVTAFRGVDAEGTWTIRVSNEGNSYVQLRDFDVTFHGSESTSDDVYHFTDDFAAMVRKEGGRATISDRNGGSDTLNFAAIAQDLTIDMRGTNGTVEGMGQNLRLNNARSFERVITGDGDDLISGTGRANTFIAMRGDDEVDGGGGHDRIDGGQGDDTLGGAGGRDTINGGQGDDHIHGDAGFEGAGTSKSWPFGAETGKGRDLLSGGAGNDTLEGGTGRDTLNGDAGNDVLDGDRGADTLDGGTGKDRLQGGGGNDTVTGGKHQDTLSGGSANDVLDGGRGGDRMFGGSGNDTLSGGASNDYLNGGTGRDLLMGGKQNDLLLGRQDNDTLLGQSGNDTLNGGTGNDLLTGGTGRDVFLFEAEFGRDVISDFGTGSENDVIDLSGVASIVNFDDLLNNHMNQDGADVRIDDGNGNEITVKNTTLGVLSESDFVF